MSIRHSVRAVVRAALSSAALSVTFGFSVGAGTVLSQQPPVRRDSTVRDSAATIGGMKITADRDRRSTLTKLTLPVSASVTSERVAETINYIDPQDAVKYLPSVFIRKRNNGDTQSVMGTRVWGVSSSARSLVFADGVPLSALIANNNTIGGPRWGLVAPETIEQVDLMYGPFSAAYAGNSIGAVMEITTRAPERLEGSITQTQSVMPFDLYRTNTTYGTSQTSARVGNRFGKLTIDVSGNYQNSESQPLTYATAGSFPTGTTGGVSASNKLNASSNVLGATGLLHTRMLNVAGKVGYDLTPTLKASYTYSFWQNDADAGAETYLVRDGVPTYAGQSAFARGVYGLLQQHAAQSLSLRSDTKGDWDIEVIGTVYDMMTDRQRFSSTAAATGLGLGDAGRVAVLSGTGWQTADVKAAWHRGGPLAAHTVTFGAHVDQYQLSNPTYETANWRDEDPVTTGLVSRGDGKTRTMAVWAQDHWRIAPSWQLTFGARAEKWRAFDGLNVNGSTSVTQPEVEATKVSPKLVLTWANSPDLKVTASVAKAYRFATASELYQLVTTGATFTSPEPNLKPDDVLATELRAERQFGRSHVQVALFNDEIHDAIISQFQPLVPGSTQLFSYLSNVDHVRARGVELVLGERDMLIPGLELSGSATYLDARTLATSGRANASAPADAAIGKQLPNIPEWRAGFVATYRPGTRYTLALGGRYSDGLWTTLDNADVNPNVYQGFSGWFVADAHANVRIRDHLTATLGVDNLLNRKYFLFHPFPQRTFSTSLKFTY